jgi:hypothetical protein
MFALESVGPNCQKITLGSLVMGFSYETIVMFSTPATGTVVCENIWSRTTGKHINMLAGAQTSRTPYDEFARLLHDTFDATLVALAR